MAKYTETLQEYLEDEANTLPEEFEQIEGFEDLFKAHYCDKEIGFETEELFKVKLSGRAGVVIPPYAERIRKLATEMLKIDNPAKTFYEKTTTTFGTQKSKTTELPIDADEAEPNVISESEQYANENEVNRTQDGKTVDELLKTIDYLNGKVKILIDELLKEFESLFMQVY